MSEHTPGPWRVIDYSSESKGFIAVVGPGEVPTHVCDVFPFGHRPGGIKRELEQHAANARLIAAAPELLEALQYIAEHDPDKPGLHGEMIDVLRSAVAGARAAIAKAENRS